MFLTTVHHNAQLTFGQHIEVFLVIELEGWTRDQVGNLVTGIVRRRERGDLIVEVGKAEAILPHRERVPGEDYVPGERIRCLLLNIDTASRGPELVLSRSNIRFVHRLFEVEIQATDPFVATYDPAIRPRRSPPDCAKRENS